MLKLLDLVKKIGKFILLVLLLFTGCTFLRKELMPKKMFVIQGRVDHCDSCQVEFGYYDQAQLKGVKMMGTTVQKGKFAFAVPEDSIPRPGVYLVKVYLNDNCIYKSNRFSEIVSRFYLPTDSISLVIDPDGSPGNKKYPFKKASSDLSFTDISSASLMQEQIDFYFRTRDSIDVVWENYENLRKAFFSQAIESGNKKEMDKWADTLNNLKYTGELYRPKAADIFIRKFPNSELVPFVMLEHYKYMSAAQRFRKYYRKMSPEQKGSFYGQVLNGRLSSMEKKNTRYAKYIVGAEITYLLGKTPEGKKIDAEKVFKSNKITLVDFWASWCDSCRMRGPAYKRLYQTYKNKGFEIIGVSLDVNGNAWQKAILAEKMEWPQLSELKGNYEDILRFRIKSLPANIVMGQDGKIVAANVSPQKLESLLKQKVK